MFIVRRPPTGVYYLGDLCSVIPYWGIPRILRTRTNQQRNFETSPYLSILC